MPHLTKLKVNTRHNDERMFVAREKNKEQRKSKKTHCDCECVCLCADLISKRCRHENSALPQKVYSARIIKNWWKKSL